MGYADSDIVRELRAERGQERERAWRELFDGHYQRVYRLVLRFGVAPEDAEDVVQRAFLIAIKRIDEVDDIRDPAAWLRGITVRVIAHHHRWRRVRETKRWLLRDTQRAGTVAPATPERYTAAAQEVALARVVMGQMSRKLRDVLVLCDVEDHAPAEAAEILQIPVNTVRSRRRLARARFAHLWNRAIGGAE